MEIKEIVKKLNEFETKNSVSKEVGIIINKYVKDLELDKQRRVVSSIKRCDELKLSPQYVYDCYRMVRTFPEMMEETWEPKVNLTVTHYFELSRFKLSDGAKGLVITDASENSWSIREMKAHINEFRDKIEPEERQRKTLMSEIYKNLKSRTNEELNEIAIHLGEKYK